MNYKFIYISLFLILFLGLLKGQDIIVFTDSTAIPEAELGEVVIRASRDDYSTLHQLPASVSVVTSSSIDENMVQSLNDASALIPNFFMPDYGSKLTSPVYIRGIGSRINAPSVGLYVDNVPYFEKSAFEFDFFDIQRIEVLRGPQGTLYGRNTMGGIVNIITRSPLEYQGTRIDLTAGTYGSFGGNVGHYGKIGEGFGYSVAANFLHHDGFFTNRFTGKKVDETNSLGFRNRLTAKLSDRLSVENILSYERSRQGGYPYAVYNDSLGKANDINYNQYSSYNRDLLSDALVVRYKSKLFDLISTSAYQHLDGSQAIDQDFLPDSLYFVTQDEKQHMISQEIILRNNTHPKYKWLMGAYGFMQFFDVRVDVDVHTSKSRMLKLYDHTIAGYALFQQLSVHDFIVKKLTLTAGLRIDSEKDELDYTYDRGTASAMSNVTDTLYPALNSLEFLPKIALNYRIGKSNIYGVIARGYKTGGFNSTFIASGDLKFNPEYSWNYEIGIKTALLKSRAYLNTAFFYIDWRNQQIYQPVVNESGIRIGSMLKNAGLSNSRGMELSMKVIPWPNMALTASYGFTDAIFTKHVVDSATNYNKNHIPHVPRNTVSIQARQFIGFKEEFIVDGLSFNLLYRGAGDIYWNEANDARQEYYGLLDAKLVVSIKQLQINFWAKNLLNTSYHAYYFEAFNNRYVQPGRPGQVGMSVSYSF